MGDNPDHPPEPSPRLAHRTNLRTRLATYRATAAANGLAHDPELAALFTEAEHLLTAPLYDPAAADRAVVTCMRALWHRLGHPLEDP